MRSIPRGDARHLARLGPPLALSLLAALASAVPSSVLAAPRRTATGIRADQHCSAATRASMDRMNRLAGRAKIRSAACGADGSLSRVVLRSVDGRRLEWKAADGRDELSRRMTLGR
jgi:hypothetical protein